MQSNVLLVQAERRPLGRADEPILLVDSSKFTASAAHALCALDEIFTIVTDDHLPTRRPGCRARRGKAGHGPSGLAEREV